MEQGGDALLSDKNEIKMNEGLAGILCLCWEGSKAERREEEGVENGLEQEVCSKRHIKKIQLLERKTRDDKITDLLTGNVW